MTSNIVQNMEGEKVVSYQRYLDFALFKLAHSRRKILLVLVFVGACVACGQDNPTQGERPFVGGEKLVSGILNEADKTEEKTRVNHLTFSSYLGGSGYEDIRDVAIDAKGNIYIAGGTDSADFPTTRGAYGTTFNDKPCTSCGTAKPMDVFVTKLSPDGKLEWSTLLGGPNYDRAYAIEVDDNGNVYIGGRAGDDFPTTQETVQPKFGGDENPNKIYGAQDPFVAKISADGSKLLWSTYFGSRDDEVARDIGIDRIGNVYVALTETGHDHPHVTSSSFNSKRQGRDAVVAKLSWDGKKVLYATYLGGSDDDGETPSIAVDEGGNAYVLMGTNSRDAPTTADAYDRSYNGGAKDMLIAKISPDGSDLLFSTYLGGSGYEGIETHGIALDPLGNVVVTFLTDSMDLPISSGAFQSKFVGLQGQYLWDGYVAKLSSDGRQLVAATYLAGDAREEIEGIAVNSGGEVYVSGTTFSENFPTTSTAFQPGFGGGKSDGFIAKFSFDLTQLLYGTFLGGSGSDGIRSMGIGGNKEIVSVGRTNSPDFPVIYSYQGTQSGPTSGTVVKVKVP